MAGAMHRHSWFGYCCSRLSQDVGLSPASGQTLPDKELLFLCCPHLSILNGKLITNCTSGWQLLTDKSFYKAQFINTKNALHYPVQQAFAETVILYLQF